MVYGHVLSHGDDEGRLTHSRAGSDDDEVGVLPARGHLVDVGEACGETTDPLLAISGDLHLVDRSLDQRIDGYEVSGRVLLCDLEE